MILGILLYKSLRIFEYIANDDDNLTSIRDQYELKHGKVFQHEM